MSVNSIINNVCFTLPQSSIKFLELTIKKGNEAYFTLRNNSRRIPNFYTLNNSLKIYPNNEDEELNSLSVIPEPFDQSPYSAMIYLLENLDDFNYEKKTALIFLSKCFEHSFFETQNIKEKVCNILFNRRERHLRYDVEVYKTLIIIYFGNNQSNNGFLSKEETMDTLINDLQKISNFFSRYQTGIYSAEFNQLIKKIAREKLFRFRWINNIRNIHQQFCDDLTAFIETI